MKVPHTLKTSYTHAVFKRLLGKHAGLPWLGCLMLHTLLLGLLTSLSLGSHAAEPIRDDLGVVLRLPHAPQRIVSLLPSLTETVCALGQCQRLVGVDRYSSFPASVVQLPKVGGGLDPNIEAIVALRPDLVLVATSSRASERLRQLGLSVAAFEPRSHADVQRVMLKLGQLLDVSDAPKIWQALDEGISAAAQSVPAAMRGTRVYFEVNPGPYAAGEASFIGETLTRLGVRNIVPAALGAFPKLNPEFIVRANPDLIMVGDASFAAMRQRPGWANMPALREQRLCVFAKAEADILVRPGPRMAEGAQLMARCLASHAKAQLRSNPNPAATTAPSSTSAKAPANAPTNRSRNAASEGGQP